MDKSVLLSLVGKGLTQKKIADIVGISQTTVVYWLNKYCLKTKASIKEEKSCKMCGEKDLSKFYKHADGRFRYCCRQCDTNKIKKRYRLYKQKAVDYKGGKCFKCGYSKCLASLDFHHLNPILKDPNWKTLRSLPLCKIKKELDKCMLVCRNCHGEIHYEDH